MPKVSKSKLSQLGDLAQRSLRFLQNAIRTHEEPKYLPKSTMLDPVTFLEYLQGIWETWCTAVRLNLEFEMGKFQKEFAQIEETMGARLQVVHPTEAITHHAAVHCALHEFLQIAVVAGHHDNGQLWCPAWVFELGLAEEGRKTFVLQDNASEVLLYRYYTRLSARVDSMAGWPLEDWEPQLRIEIAAASGSRSETPPTWERLRLDASSGFALLDGENIPVGQGRPLEFLQLLIERQGQPVRDADIKKRYRDGEKASRLFNRLPEAIQAMIHTQKTDGKTGYWLLP